MTDVTLARHLVTQMNCSVWSLPNNSPLHRMSIYTTQP